MIGPIHVQECYALGPEGDEGARWKTWENLTLSDIDTALEHLPEEDRRESLGLARELLLPWLRLGMLLGEARDAALEARAREVKTPS